MISSHRNIISKLLINNFNFHKKGLCSAQAVQGREMNVKKYTNVTMLGFNRPEKKNSLNINMINQLKEEIIKFENDETSNALVIYGERGNFSKGLDEELASQQGFFEILDKIDFLNLYCNKPTVAAISGFATGFAFDIALWCDFMVVEDTAVMANYNRKLIDRAITEERAHRLYHRLGFQKTLDVILTGRMLTAKEAFNSGIASRIVACGTGLGQAVNFAKSLAHLPQESLKADKRLIYSLIGIGDNKTSE